MFGKKIKKDCVFKKNEPNGCIGCAYPKFYKNCYLCSTYISNDGEIDDKLKYVEFVSKRAMNFWSLIFSFMAFLISSLTLILKVTGYW